MDHDCASFGMAFRSNLRGDGFSTQSLPRAGFTTEVGRERARNRPRECQLVSDFEELRLRNCPFANRREVSRVPLVPRVRYTGVPGCRTKSHPPRGSHGPQAPQAHDMSSLHHFPWSLKNQCEHRMTLSDTRTRHRLSNAALHPARHSATSCGNRHAPLTFL